MGNQKLKAKRRVGIYFFYDVDGIVDEYIYVMLRALIPHFEKIIFVSNGPLTHEASQRLANETSVNLLVRENRGFDAWAYKEALLDLGWDALNYYDELILLNFTIVGPVNSFADVFAEMDTQEIDFWGLTVHNGANWDPFGFLPDGYLPLHLQSHFIAIRKQMFGSPEFRDYWEKLPEINSYEEAVGKHEAIFTKHFEDYGFTWKSFVDTKDLIGHSYYPLLDYPVDLIENRKCPVFKRRTFVTGIDGYIMVNDHRVAHDLYEYLHKKTTYDFDYLWPNLSRTIAPEVLAETLSMVEVVNDNEITVSENGCTASLIVIVSDQEARNLADAAIKSLSGFVNIQKFHIGEFAESSKETQKLDNGWISVGQKIDVYRRLGDFDQEIICLIDLGEDSGEFLFSNRRAKIEAIFRNFIHTDEQIAQIINLFNQEQYLSLLVQPPPIHGTYLRNYYEGPHAAHVRENSLSTALQTGAVWFRKSVFNFGQYSTENSDEHAFQNYDFVAKTLKTSQTHYSTVLSSSMVPTRITVLDETLRRASIEIANATDGVSNVADLTDKLSQVCQEASLARMESRFSTFTAYFDLGNGYSSDNIFVGNYQHRQDEDLTIAEFSVPEHCKSVRFDPIENSICIIQNIHVNSGSFEITPLNKLRSISDVDMFLSSDPQYEIIFDEATPTSIQISFRAISVAPIKTRFIEEVNSIHSNISLHSSFVKKFSKLYRATQFSKQKA